MLAQNQDRRLRNRYNDTNEAPWGFKVTYQPLSSPELRKLQSLSSSQSQPSAVTSAVAFDFVDQPEASTAARLSVH